MLMKDGTYCNPSRIAVEPDSVLARHREELELAEDFGL